MRENMERINNLFEELVPATGKADTVAGEMVRATARLGYRFFNDGDQLGIGYGRETCNAAGRYLAQNASVEIARQITDMWELYSDEVYERKLDTLCGTIADYIEANPELKAQENTDCFWDYYDKDEDVDTYDDEEEAN